MTHNLIATEESAGGTPRMVSPTYPVPINMVTAAVAANKATFVRGLKAPAATGTPERIADVGTFVQSVLIVAQRASRVANAGTVYIDASAADGSQLIALAPGQSFPIEAPPGKVIDLGDIYVDAATLTDGVFFFAAI